MTTAQIIENPEFKTALIDILAYQIIDGKDSLYIHKNNKTDLVYSTRDNGRNQSARAYTEFVHATTLVSILGLNHEIEDGMIEAEQIINWMRSQN